MKIQSSAIFLDYGNKYEQKVTPLTPKHNIANKTVLHQNTVDVGNNCARMEDYGQKLIFSENIMASIVCDGHGSVELHEGIFVGGFECAKFVAENVLRLLELELQILSNKNSLNNNDKDIMKMLERVFDETQESLVNEITSKKYTNVIDGKILQELKTSLGIHVDKLKSVEKDDLNVFYYSKKSSSIEQLKEIPIEYGTTATLLLIIDDTVFIANTGDSECFCYKNDSNDNGETKIYKCTQTHGKENLKEIQRVLKFSPDCDISSHPKYFGFSMGSFCSKNIMPSRSFGHTSLCTLGITHKPFITQIKAQKTDLFVVASDGFWENPIYQLIVAQNFNQPLESILGKLESAKTFNHVLDQSKLVYPIHDIHQEGTVYKVAYPQKVDMSKQIRDNTVAILFKFC